jgi:hypothetical protein
MGLTHVFDWPKHAASSRTLMREMQFWASVGKPPK